MLRNTSDFYFNLWGRDEQTVFYQAFIDFHRGQIGRALVALLTLVKCKEYKLAKYYFQKGCKISAKYILFPGDRDEFRSMMERRLREQTCGNR